MPRFRPKRTPRLRHGLFRAYLRLRIWMGGRVVECARLESVLGLNNLRGFESHPIRHPRRRRTRWMRTSVRAERSETDGAKRRVRFDRNALF